MSVEVKTFFLQIILAGLFFVGCSKPNIEPVPHVLEARSDISSIPIVQENTQITFNPIAVDVQKSKDTFPAKLSPKKIPLKATLQPVEVKNKITTDSLQPKKLKDIGPNEWTVNDIIKKVKYGKVPEKEVIEHILSVRLPYKKFNYDEIQIMLKCGLSYKIINSMIVVSK